MSPIYRTRSIIVLDLVKKTHRCNAQQAGKRQFLILEFLLFFGEATLLPLSFTLFCAALSSFLAVSYRAMVHETEHWLRVRVYEELSLYGQMPAKILADVHLSSR